MSGEQCCLLFNNYNHEWTAVVFNIRVRANVVEMAYEAAFQQLELVCGAWASRFNFPHLELTTLQPAIHTPTLTKRLSIVTSLTQSRLSLHPQLLNYLSSTKDMLCLLYPRVKKQFTLALVPGLLEMSAFGAILCYEMEHLVLYSCGPFMRSSYHHRLWSWTPSFGRQRVHCPHQ